MQRSYTKVTYIKHWTFEGVSFLSSKKRGVNDVEQTQVLTDAKAKAQEVARKAAAGFYCGGVRGC